MMMEGTCAKGDLGGERGIQVGCYQFTLRMCETVKEQIKHIFKRKSWHIDHHKMVCKDQKGKDRNSSKTRSACLIIAHCYLLYLRSPKRVGIKEQLRSYRTVQNAEMNKQNVQQEL